MCVQITFFFQPIKAHEIYSARIPERKLLLLIAQMKIASERFRLSVPSVDSRKDFMSKTTFVSEKCFARGMGLLLAVRGRKACFTILLDSTEYLDMVVEIQGPYNTACSKRITSASLYGSDSLNARDLKDAEIQEAILRKEIPLEYSIWGHKITVCK